MFIECIAIMLKLGMCFVIVLNGSSNKSGNISLGSWMKNHMQKIKEFLFRNPVALIRRIDFILYWHGAKPQMQSSLQLCVIKGILFDNFENWCEIKMRQDLLCFLNKSRWLALDHYVTSAPLYFDLFWLCFQSLFAAARFLCLKSNSGVYPQWSRLLLRDYHCFSPQI